MCLGRSRGFLSCADPCCAGRAHARLSQNLINPGDVPDEILATNEDLCLQPQNTSWGQPTYCFMPCVRPFGFSCGVLPVYRDYSWWRDSAIVQMNLFTNNWGVRILFAGVWLAS